MPWTASALAHAARNQVPAATVTDAEISLAQAAYDLFADDLSRRTFQDQLAIRWGTGLGPSDPPETHLQPDQYFPKGIYRHRPDEVFIDCGGFDGDTVAALLEHGPAQRIISFEPDPGCFARLKSRLSEFCEDTHITCREVALSDTIGRRRFNPSGIGDSCFAEHGSIEVAVTTLDQMMMWTNPTFIKMDIEGAEPLALQGGAATIRRCQPMLAICVYHVREQLWEIPLQMQELCPEHTFYLRHHATGRWEVVCYAVPPGRPTE